jgi:hypothetical protein
MFLNPDTTLASARGSDNEFERFVGTLITWLQPPFSDDKPTCDQIITLWSPEIERYEFLYSVPLRRYRTNNRGSLFTANARKEHYDRFGDQGHV